MEDNRRERKVLADLMMEKSLWELRKSGVKDDVGVFFSDYDTVMISHGRERATGPFLHRVF